MLHSLIRLPIPPEEAVLAAARLSLSRTLRRHLLVLTGEILRALRTLGTAASERGVHYRKLLDEYHAKAAHHVGRSSPMEVALNWRDYCQSAADMRALLRKRMDAKSALICPHLLLLPHISSVDGALS